MGDIDRTVAIGTGSIGDGDRAATSISSSIIDDHLDDFRQELSFQSSTLQEESGIGNDDQPSNSSSSDGRTTAINEASSSTHVQTGQPQEEDLQQQQLQPQQESQENNGEAERNRNGNNNPPVLLTLIAMIWQLSKLWIRFILSAMTITIPTKYLHIISIILLSLHRIISKIMEYIPHLWIAIFRFVGFENIPKELQNLVEEQYGFRHSPILIGSNIITLETVPDSDTKMSEIAIFKRILEITIGQIMLSPKSSDLDNHEQRYNHPQGSKTLFEFFEKWIVSIMIPTTILSIFLLITMTVFLLLHIIFQAFLYILSYLATSNNNMNSNASTDGNNDNQIRGGREGNENDDNNVNRSNGRTTSSNSVSSSPFVLWGILSILILETAVPWICLSVGVYLSFSVGGFVFLLFIIFTIFIYFGLRRLRNRITIDFQEGRIGTSNAF
mmetsp:Transcript_1768/g.2554  ORF Transcript_1768/g.2554 Transcript_1768/m.2554 type:complete len:442 (-) Transcript_1768:111-1436(-)